MKLFFSSRPSDLLILPLLVLALHTHSPLSLLLLQEEDETAGIALGSAGDPFSCGLGARRTPRHELLQPKAGEVASRPRAVDVLVFMSHFLLLEKNKNKKLKGREEKRRKKTTKRHWMFPFPFSGFSCANKRRRQPHVRWRLLSLVTTSVFHKAFAHLQERANEFWFSGTRCVSKMCSESRRKVLFSERSWF